MSLTAYNEHIFFQIKCICHSLALVVKHAFEKFVPDNIAVLLHKIPAHFGRSTLRRKEFLEVQKAMGDEENTHPFNRYVETRWLARGKVLRAIHNNWDALLAYLVSIQSNVPQEQRFEVEKLIEILKDRSNYAMVAFLLPIIEKFESLNQMFQVQ